MAGDLVAAGSCSTSEARSLYFDLEGPMASICHTRRVLLGSLGAAGQQPRGLGVMDQGANGLSAAAVGPTRRLVLGGLGAADGPGC